MRQLTVADIGNLQDYLQQRPAIRQAIMEHKQGRRVYLGPNASLHFEDYMTMKYQVQEMMRAENLRTPEAIEEELEAYNPLIPDGRNLKCTFMIEFPEVAERRQALSRLVGIEQRVFIQIGAHEAVAPIANEDLERSTADKTSAVHFMRYEFSDAMVADAKAGAPWRIYCDHPAYLHEVSPLPGHIAASLTRDFN